MTRLVMAAMVVVACATAAAAQDGAALYTQHCAMCHDGAARAPSKQILSALPQDRIVTSLTSGFMRTQGEKLSPDERTAVARFLSTTATVAAASSAPTCDASRKPPAGTSDWGSWGVTLSNERLQKSPGFTTAQIPNLKLRWAFGFEGEVEAAANPTIAGDRVSSAAARAALFAGTHDGCVAWAFKADAGVRAAVVVGVVKSGEPATAFVSDVRATVYGVDATTGALKWARRLEEHPAARITGSPVLYNGRLYVPMSSMKRCWARSSPTSVASSAAVSTRSMLRTAGQCGRATRSKRNPRRRTRTRAA